MIDPTVVVGLGDPGVDLTAPADGRLRGAGVALLVTGAALTNVAGQGIQAVSAGPGQHLIVFAVRQLPIPQDQQPGAPPSLVLVVNGGRRSIDLSALLEGQPSFYAASMPAGATDVRLELSSAGFAQRFSLLTLVRPGPDPAVLYRDPDLPNVVSDVRAETVVTATVPAIGFSCGERVQVKRAVLSWLSPGPSGETAPALDRAFLAIEAAGLHATPTHFVDGFAHPMPADHVHLLLPDGSKVDAAHTGGSGASSVQLFDGTYYFPVPSDLTSATLSVDPISIDGAEFEQVFGLGATINLPGYTIGLSLPAVPTAPRPTTPTTVLKLSRGEVGSRPSSAESPHSHNSSVPWILIVVLVLATGVAGLAWVLLRRHRPVPSPAVELTPAVGGPAPDTATTVGPSWVGATGSGHLLQSATTSTIAVGDSVSADPLEEHPGSAVPEALPVLVMGPIELPGLDTSPLRPVDLELAVYLAVHSDRPVSGDKLREALSKDRAADPSADTIRTYASRVRRAFGSDRFPAATSGKYQLSGVETDWARFGELTIAAGRAADPTEIMRLLGEALTLVRGVPFAESGYRWPDRELLTNHMEKAVADAADRLATVASQLGDLVWASWAVERGLLGISYPDERLLAHRLRIGARQGTGPLGEAWRAVTARLVAVDDAPSTELVALYDSLRHHTAEGP